MTEKFRGTKGRDFLRRWGMKRGAANRIVPLAWDSAFFGFPIGRAYVLGITAGTLDAELGKARSGKLEFIELFCDVADFMSVRAAEGTGFRLADLKCHLKKSLYGQARIRPAEIEGLSFEKILRRDIHRLDRVENGLFRESRYYRYPRFERGRVDLMFRRWLENAVLAKFDDECHVLSRGKTICAFCTIRSLGETKSSIGLFAVRKAFRGRGLGGVLLGHVAALLSRRGVAELEVATQGRNGRALDLYQRNGFTLNSATLVYYKSPV